MIPAWAARAADVAGPDTRNRLLSDRCPGGGGCCCPDGRPRDLSRFSCSGLRSLGIKDQPRRLLATVNGSGNGTEMAEPEVCCGFGGTFCVKYPDISNKMVGNKTDDILGTDAESSAGGRSGLPDEHGRQALSPRRTGARPPRRRGPGRHVRPTGNRGGEMRTRHGTDRRHGCEKRAAPDLGGAFPNAERDFVTRSMQIARARNGIARAPSGGRSGAARCCAPGRTSMLGTLIAPSPRAIGVSA